MKIYIVLCALAYMASVEAVGEANQSMPLDAAFVREGVVYAPVSFDHLTFFLPWGNLIQPLRSLRGRLRSEVDKYTKFVMASNDSYNPSDRKQFIEGSLKRHFKRFDAVISEVELMTHARSPSGRARRGLWGGLETVVTGVNSVGTFTNGRALDNVIDRQHQLVHEIVLNRDYVSMLQHLIKKSMDRVADYMADDRLVWAMTELMDEFIRDAEKKLEAIFQLEQNHMSPAWITSIDVEAMLKGVTERAHNRGLVPLGEGLAILLEAPKSHELNGTMASITLHIPLVPKESTGPMWLLRMSSAKATKRSLALEFSAKRPYLAVSENLLTHFTLSEEELTECVRQSRSWLCPRRRVIERSPTDCVSCLFYKKQKCVLANCGKQWQADPRAVVELGHGEFMLQGVSHAVLTCPTADGNGTVTQSLEGHREVSINKTCRLEAPEAIVFPEEDSSSKFIVHRIGFDLEVNITEEAFNSLELNLAEIEIPKVKELSPDPITSTRVLIIVLIIGGVLLLVICVGCSFCCLYRKEMRMVRELPQVVERLAPPAAAPVMEHVRRALFEYAMAGHQSSASASPPRRESGEARQAAITELA